MRLASPVFREAKLYRHVTTYLRAKQENDALRIPQERREILSVVMQSLRRFEEVGDSSMLVPLVVVDFSGKNKEQRCES
jgi:hypothetical protein